MKTIARVAVLALICVALPALTGCNEEKEIGVGRFVGIWTIDVDRSVENARRSSATAKQDASFFESRMGAVTIEINPSELILFVQDAGNAMPFQFQDADATSTTLAVTMGDETHRAVLTALDGSHMNIQLSAAPDFNACVWRRAL